MKQKYQHPCVELIRMENEGIMAASVTYEGGSLDDFTGKDPAFSSGSTKGSTMQDLENMINDILTTK